MRKALQKFTAAIAGALILGMAAGDPGITLTVFAAEVQSEETAVTGNAAAESAIAAQSMDTLGLADNQEALAEYLVQLQTVIEQQTAALSVAEEEEERVSLPGRDRC